jgi:hypothetical protein
LNLAHRENVPHKNTCKHRNDAEQDSIVSREA